MERGQDAKRRLPQHESASKEQDACEGKGDQKNPAQAAKEDLHPWYTAVSLVAPTSQPLGSPLVAFPRS
jgi:hypothetical protein